jgi:hypothetical protein
MPVSSDMFPGTVILLFSLPFTVKTSFNLIKVKKSGVLVNEKKRFKSVNGSHYPDYDLNNSRSDIWNFFPGIYEDFSF